MDELLIILTAVVIAINCAILGSFLLLRGMSMIGDALSHAVLPGIVIAFFITGEYNSVLSLILATIFGLGAVFFINFLSSKGSFDRDASIGIMYTFLFSIGVILVSSFAKNADIDVECVLFGDLGNLPFLPGISICGTEIPTPTIIVVFVNLLIIFTVSKGLKGFSISGFDPLFAGSLGIRVVFWNNLLLALTSINTVASFDAVGAIMVISLLVIPAAFAFLFTKSIVPFIRTAVVFAVMHVFAGYYLAIALDLNLVATMSFLMGIVFLIALVLHKKMKN